MLQFKTESAIAISLRALGHFVGKETPKAEKRVLEQEVSKPAVKAIKGFFEEVNYFSSKMGKKIVRLGSTQEMTDEELLRIIANQQRKYNEQMVEFFHKGRKELFPIISEQAKLEFIKEFLRIDATDFMIHIEKSNDSRNKRLNALLGKSTYSYWNNLFPELSIRWTGKNLVNRALKSGVLDNVKARLEIEEEEGNYINDDDVMERIKHEIVQSEIEAAVSEIDHKIMPDPDVLLLKEKLPDVVEQLFNKNENLFLEVYDEV